MVQSLMGDDASLGANERELLRRVTAKYSPETLGLVDAVGARPLNDDERKALRAGLAEEFVSVGLMEDSEPNEYGVEVDDLIGRLMFF
jgi:hypothetical protein